MSAVTGPPAWPADSGHCEAIETLLAMAEAENRWGNPHRALDLFNNVEQIVGTLPPPYDQIRLRCRSHAGQPAVV